MANHKSAIKRHKQSLKRRDSNRVSKLKIKEVLKKARTAAEKGDKAEAKKLASDAERILAKAARKRIVHKKNAARRVSRLMSAVQK